MEISALVTNAHALHEVTVRTETISQSLAIPAKPTGKGSAVNGGELLMLALATCYCNDLYREAARLNIPVDGVEVEAIRYRAHVYSPADASAIADLLSQTDTVAEVHNTIRTGAAVALLA